MRAILAVLFVVVMAGGWASAARTGAPCKAAFFQEGITMGTSCYRKCDDDNTCILGTCFEISVKRFALGLDENRDDPEPTRQQLKTIPPLELMDNKGVKHLNRFNICIISRVISFMLGNTASKYLAVRKMENFTCFMSNDFGSCRTTLTLSGVCVAGSCQRTCNLTSPPCHIGNCYSVRKDFHAHIRAYVCLISLSAATFSNMFAYSYYHYDRAHKALPVEAHGFNEIEGWREPASVSKLAEINQLDKKYWDAFRKKALTDQDKQDVDIGKELVDLYYYPGFSPAELKALGWGDKTVQHYQKDYNGMVNQRRKQGYAKERVDLSLGANDSMMKEAIALKKKQLMVDRRALQNI